MSNYHGTSIHADQCKALEDLEKAIGEPIPFLSEATYWIDFGFKTHDKNVIKLGFYSPGLKTLPQSFCKLTKLRELNLNGNKLNTLPDCIGDFTDLYNLHAAGCELTFLPESIGKLSSLKILVLECNYLTSLPITIGLLNKIEQLALWGNNLKFLPKELLKIKTLKYISVIEKLANDPVFVELYKRNKLKINTDPYDWTYLK